MVLWRPDSTKPLNCHTIYIQSS